MTELFKYYLKTGNYFLNYQSLIKAQQRVYSALHLSAGCLLSLLSWCISRSGKLLLSLKDTTAQLQQWISQSFLTLATCSFQRKLDV